MKNWIIRTKTNYILGPVSREKLIELIHSGSLTDEDELCSGNGFWFYFREKDLLDHYLLNGHKQGFNPVSEALNEKKLREENGPKDNNSEVDDITVIMKSK
jgi:hypothetical protein